MLTVPIQMRQAVYRCRIRNGYFEPDQDDSRRARAADVYDAGEKADEILTAVTGLDATDSGALLDFVNKWGLLHRGRMASYSPSTPKQQFMAMRSVEAVRRAIVEIQRLAKWLHALQHRMWGSDALPPDSDLPAVAGGRVDRGVHTARQQALWAAFAKELDRVLRRRKLDVRVEIEAGSTRLLQVLYPQSLLDVLYLILGYCGSEDGTELRQCKGCRSQFRVVRSNRKKRYHDEDCQNRSRVRRWREGRRRKGPISRRRGTGVRRVRT